MRYIPLAAILLLIVAGCSGRAGDNLPTFAASDRNGVAYDQGRAECDEQAQQQSSGIASTPERLHRLTELSNACMRARGY